MSVALLYDPLFLEHQTGQHPENPGRLRAVVARLREEGLWDEVQHLSFEPASRDALEAVHSSAYLQFLDEVSAAGGGWLTTDTVMSPRSYEVARMAAGAAVRAVEAVVGGGTAGGWPVSCLAMSRKPASLAASGWSASLSQSRSGECA